jgi:hypothetical protein
MKFRSAQYFGALCLIARWQHADAKSDSKDEEVAFPNLETILDSPPGCGSSAGCVVATGSQVVQVATSDTTASFSLGSRSAFGQFTFEFDPGFTQLKYATRAYDPENSATTFDVDDVRLVCLLAGQAENANTAAPLLRGVEAVEDITIATLQVTNTGALAEGLFIDDGNLNLTPVACDPTETGNPVSITTIAALYESMIRGDVAILFEVKDRYTQSTTLIRGQAFLPQEYY